uniref:Uncharacterized protein n=1 Tax=Anolis carolinensis TaxID=28377 RepID=A0A803TZJ4_ANOCA
MLNRWKSQVFLLICHNSTRNGTTRPMRHHTIPLLKAPLQHGPSPRSLWPWGDHRRE